MRNLWKGFVVGGVTGAGVGFALGRSQQRKLANTSGAQAGQAGPSEQSGASAARRFAPDSVWKGFILGALTGSAVGLVADLGERSGHDLAVAAAHTGQAIREHGPELAHQLADSDAAHAVSEAAQQATEGARRAAQTASSVAQTASSVAQDTAHAVEDALPTS